MTQVPPDEPLGSHVLELEVTAVVEETDDARSLVFGVPAGSDTPADRLRYAPGQFLTLRIPSERTVSVARCYSLCSSPFTDDALTVTVKRTADGYASNWLCDHAHKGMRLHVLAPSGTFVPKTLDDDFLLIAAGSGITPMLAICKSALSQGSGRVTLLYANRDERSVIFAGTLRELGAKYPDRLTVVHWLETVQGLPSTAALSPSGVRPTSESSLLIAPWGTKQSGTARRSVGTCKSMSARASQTAAPKPPMLVFSSMVTTSLCDVAAHETVSKSSGLIQRALTTLAETPEATSSSAAFSAVSTMRPTARSATSVPRERTSALPASQPTGVSGSSRPRPAPRG